MLTAYRIFCGVLLILFITLTSRGTPIVNFFSGKVGAQKGAQHFHK